jgi:hypothetical protein
MWFAAGLYADFADRLFFVVVGSPLLSWVTDSAASCHLFPGTLVPLLCGKGVN